MSKIHTPSRSLIARLQRRASHYVHRRAISPQLDTPIVSFSFDDCPQSAYHHLPLLEAEGWRATLYVCAGLAEKTNHLGLHMSLEEIEDAARRGHEIGEHTRDHVDAGQITNTQFLENIKANQAALKAIGLPASRSFAYPYGNVRPSIKRLIADRFDTARGVHPPEGHSVDLALIPSYALYSGADITTAITKIHKLANAPQWITLFGHDIRDNPSVYGCSQEDLRAVIAACKTVGARVLPVSAAMDFIAAQRLAAT